MIADDAPAPEPALSVEQLLPLVYQELRAVARRERIRLDGGETLATTALIHEAYLRLRDHAALPSRADFLRLSAVAMRRILVDRVRAQLADKRGAGALHVPMEEADEIVVEDDTRVLAVNDALERLAELNARLVAIVECRFFGGYSEVETAEALGLSERTVQREWSLARAWLRTQLAS